MTPALTLSCLIEVGPRERGKDPASLDALHEAQALGVEGLSGAEVSRLYELTGEIGAQTAELAARELLSDPVTESFTVTSPGRQPFNDPRLPEGVVVDVWYKPQVTDPAVETVEKGLRDLGMKPMKVRCGMRARFFGDFEPALFRTLAGKFLANPAIQYWAVEPIGGPR